MENYMQVELRPKIVKKDAFQIAGISCETMMEERKIKIPKLMEQFHALYLHQLKKRIDAPVSFGLFVDPPNWNEEIDPFTWIAAVKVEGAEELPSGFLTKNIPAYTYAVLDYDPEIHAENPYPFLHRWAEEHEYQLIEGFGFESYHPFTGADTKFTLHLPVKRK
ncbi:GyrI-like domain-containing protein [Halobacillus salinarum]|uniref:GyrI-like domain-containing protein n=1 Tax=Halobacillus salinarum TaxID=2932257 RepID=A0ABY4EMC6_9BACI|nr:effector binding domain-containing protein [Halobacillus salinarum]UOQ45147.1 GyrI-like domain-containing protein [Halobacillus salinarum]